MSKQVYLDLMLTPHRSLGPKGLIAVGATFAACLSLVAAWFFAVGAWPVVGFAGLDLVLVSLLLVLHHRSGKQRERILLTDAALTVCCARPGAPVSCTTLEPGWLKVACLRDGVGRPGVGLGSSGRWRFVGQFLTPPEQATLAEEIRRALRHWKRGSPNGENGEQTEARI